MNIWALLWGWRLQFLWIRGKHSCNLKHSPLTCVCFFRRDMCKEWKAWISQKYWGVNALQIVNMPLSANKEAFLPTGVLLDGCFSLTGNLTLLSMTTPGGQPCLRCWKWSVWSENPQPAKSHLNQTSCPFKLSAEEQRYPWTLSACFMAILYLRVTHCLSHLAVCLNWKVNCRRWILSLCISF